jgi:hypothetical protein
MDDIQIVVFGNLLDHESISKTIPARPYRLINIKRFRYVFNLKPKNVQKYPDAKLPETCAVLNVAPDKASNIPAGMITVTAEEFEKLKNRMKSYYTKQVKAYDFSTDQKIAKAIMFIGKKKIYGDEVVSEYYLPIPSHLHKARETAQSIGKAFGEAFDKNSFLANGIPLKEYLGKEKI